MIVGTLKAFEALLLVARLRLVDQGMELLLFPAVAKSAGLESLAPFSVAGDERATLPVFAKFDFVVKEIRSAAEVLEVVGVDALGLVVLVVERTPLCLEVEHVKVEVNLVWHDHLVQQANFYVLH